ncbi:hypothetical protein [Thiohalophilus sp.]|uniref:hypothetical protein n=1 Tax=Thiohalophilus sp. TaxID=3028392 RepID=UPI002ACECB54|nr:hypothetical protein [Thiohalophilus sp.]MDZ7661967.1 hypothetical protein [Thiohalophilus sp.]
MLQAGAGIQSRTGAPPSGIEKANHEGAKSRRIIDLLRVFVVKVLLVKRPSPFFVGAGFDRDSTRFEIRARGIEKANHEDAKTRRIFGLLRVFVVKVLLVKRPSPFFVGAGFDRDSTRFEIRARGIEKANHEDAKTRRIIDLLRAFVSSW